VPRVEVEAALQQVRARIEAACRVAGRPAESVCLVAVSKTHPAEAIRAAYEAGQRDFGESYAQELADKAPALADLPELRWHFLGPLQRNKAKVVAHYACTVHALESFRVASALSVAAHAAARTLSACVQVNVSGEPSKHGVTPSELPALLAEARSLEHLRVAGLMTLPPPEPDAARAAFRELAALARSHGLAELSMGMSDDLEIAIAEGATHVRVGTAIFGSRPPR